MFLNVLIADFCNYSTTSAAFKFLQRMNPLMLLYRFNKIICNFTEKDILFILKIGK